MKVNTISDPMRDDRMPAKIRQGLLAAGCAMLLVAGCAQNESYKSPPIETRSAGLATAGDFQAVAVEDLDSDGHLDVIGGATNPGMVTINYGDGRGGVSEPQILPIKGQVRSVAVADFNEDGLNDIVYSVQKASTGIRVWMNQSKRRWKDARGPIEINKYQSVKTADINGDGHMDVIAANATAVNQGGIQVWLGDGKGGWFGESGPTVTGQYMDVAVGDLNGDKALDLVGAGWGTLGALRIWFGDGAGNWSAGSRIGPGNFYGINFGDVNGDGNLDLLVGTHRSGPQVYQGDGRGNFRRINGPAEFMKRRSQAHPGQYKDAGKEFAEVVADSFWTVLPIDLDQDDRIDILASSITRKGILAWHNLGQNRWEPVKGQFPSSGTFYEMTKADLNGDEFPDVCAASSGGGIKAWPGKAGAFLTARSLEIEPLTEANRLAVLQAPLENDVFATINGVVEYKIGPGDILEITSWKVNEPTKEEILVRQDGKISFGFVEDLPVSGLTSSQLDALLTRHIAEYVRKPRIDVVVKAHNSKFVTLFGAVADRGVGGKGPGKYKLTGKITLLDAVTKAGGPTLEADLSNVTVRRKDGRSVTLDLFKAIQEGKPEHDFILDDGDVVFLPTYKKSGNRVYVFGEVKKPGAYDYTGMGMRLFDVIAEAGGSTVFAANDNTKVVRGDPTRPEIISADLESLVQEGDQSQNVLLASGDLIYVPPSGWGEINIMNKRIRPLWEMILWPARTIIDWDRAADLWNNP